VRRRFPAGHVFATARQIADWSSWAMKAVTRLLAARAARKAEILQAVRWGYREPFSRIRHDGGMAR